MSTLFLMKIAFSGTQIICGFERNMHKSSEFLWKIARQFLVQLELDWSVSYI